ncbi:hypothetical protein P7K49_020568 [Saguinus oedipus]|uniref:Uncharacterized protein n=1 Tax=Saguinus oedipus TaxID=9490 RepID=A0ABQ9V0Y8_SAGOE|nr:hypothetical protein P7K49_020568 [Saguinus oedipus]
MASGHTFQPDLVKRIRDAIRMGLSARHVPSLILETKGIPEKMGADTLWGPGEADFDVAGSRAESEV